MQDNTDSSALNLTWATSSGEQKETPVDAGSRTMHLLRHLLFNLIRPLFVRNIKSYEEFLCEECRGPVLRRVVFCSSKCHTIHAERWIRRFKNHQ